MLLHILRVLIILFEVVVLFNLLIIVHELGHFLAARWRGLVIEKFGVWFGKPLWKTKINGIQYSLGSIPFGGFVSVPQLAPMDIIEGKADLDRAKLSKISALDKIIVAVAGPVFSLLHRYGISYVEIDNRLTDPGAIDPRVGLTWWAEQGLPVVASTDHITIYDVRGRG